MAPRALARGAILFSMGAPRTRRHGDEDGIPAPHASTRQVWRVLLAVWLVAFGVRCLYLWQISHAPFFGLRIGDADVYDQWARRIAGGDWLGHDVFYQAPLYPYFLAAVYRTLGESAIAVRLTQACIGATSCALVAAAGMSLFSRWGALAGLALAFYPTAIFLDGLLEKSSLVMCFTAALLALLARPPERMTPRHWLGAGVILGLLALTRENALLLALPILLWIRAAAPASSLKAATLFLAGCAIVLLPVGLRNLAVSGELHLTTSQFGPNFYIGNHAGATGSYDALVVGHGNAADEREDATRLAEQASGHRLSPKEVSTFWTKQALAYIRSQPRAWLGLMARKLALTFNAAYISDTESLDVYAEWSWLLRLLRWFDFGVVLALGTLGVALTRRSWRRLWVFYGVGATYALSVALFYVFERYRFPIVPILLLFAAGGLAEARRMLEQPRRRSLAPAAAAAIGALALAHLPLENAHASRATHYAAVATTLARDPARIDSAMEFYKRALTEAPQFPEAQFGIGTLLARMGRTAEAIPYYRQALALWPEHAEARYDLGLALAATGHHEEAAEQYREALRIRPDDVEAHIAFGKVLLAQQRPGVAAQHYEAALARQPDNVTALVGLGVALTHLGRVEDALVKYRRALDLDPRNGAAHNSLGWTLAMEGRLNEAVPHFERALELNPGDENARRNLEQARRVGRR
jgi:tetratricopeptide (TPR) repeat protein